MNEPQPQLQKQPESQPLAQSKPTGPELGKKLLEAAKKGEVKEADFLIRSKANIHFKDTAMEEIDGKWRAKGCTALHWAAIHNKVDMIAFLLHQRANINRKDTEDGLTALHWASRLGKTESASFLLHNKAQIDCQDENEWTPLHHASREGRVEVVAMLLYHNATIDSKTNSEWTPLQFVSLEGHAEVAAMLLHHKADIHSKDTDGGTPLHRASRNGQSAVVGLLLASKADLAIENKAGKLPGQEFAATHYRTAIEKILGDYKMDPNQFEAQKVDTMTKAVETEGKTIQRMQEFLAQKAEELRARGREQASLDRIAQDRSAIEIAELKAEKAKAQEERKKAQDEAAKVNLELDKVKEQLERSEAARQRISEELKVTKVAARVERIRIEAERDEARRLLAVLQANPDWGLILNKVTSALVLSDFNWVVAMMKELPSCLRDDPTGISYILHEPFVSELAVFCHAQSDKAYGKPFKRDQVNPSEPMFSHLCDLSLSYAELLNQIALSSYGAHYFAINARWVFPYFLVHPFHQLLTSSEIIQLLDETTHPSAKSLAETVVKTNISTLEFIISILPQEIWIHYESLVPLKRRAQNHNREQLEYSSLPIVSSVTLFSNNFPSELHGDINWTVAKWILIIWRAGRRNKQIPSTNLLNLPLEKEHQWLEDFGWSLTPPKPVEQARIKHSNAPQEVPGAWLQKIDPEKFNAIKPLLDEKVKRVPEEIREWLKIKCPAIDAAKVVANGFDSWQAVYYLEESDLESVPPPPPPPPRPPPPLHLLPRPSQPLDQQIQAQGKGQRKQVPQDQDHIHIRNKYQQDQNQNQDQQNLQAENVHAQVGQRQAQDQEQQEAGQIVLNIPLNSCDCPLSIENYDFLTEKALIARHPDLFQRIWGLCFPFMTADAPETLTLGQLLRGFRSLKLAPHPNNQFEALAQIFTAKVTILPVAKRSFCSLDNRERFKTALQNPSTLFPVFMSEPTFIHQFQFINELAQLKLQELKINQEGLSDKELAQKIYILLRKGQPKDVSIRDWLSNLGHELYEENFAQAGFDTLESFGDLSPEDQNRAGIQQDGDFKVILGDVRREEGMWNSAMKKGGMSTRSPPPLPPPPPPPLRIVAAKPSTEPVKQNNRISEQVKLFSFSLVILIASFVVFVFFGNWA